LKSIVLTLSYLMCIIVALFLTYILSFVLI
jgi:hypothetical protein